MKKLLLLSILSGVSGLACAGQGAFLSIENNSDTPVHLKLADEQCMSENAEGFKALKAGIILQPGDIKTQLYLEAKNSSWTCWARSSIIHVDAQANGIALATASFQLTAKGAPTASVENAKTKPANFNDVVVAAGSTSNILGIFGSGSQDELLLTIPPEKSTTKHFEHWMEEDAADIENTPFNEIVIPGAHDAFTDNLDSAGILCPGEASGDDFLTKLGKQYGTSMGLRYAKAQLLSIDEQLKHGVRYFDIRLCNMPGAKGVYPTHAYIGKDKIETYWNKINQFLNEHPKEIVILDLQSIYGFDNTIDQNQALMAIKNIFKDKLLTNDNNLSITPKELWKSGKQVILVASVRDPLPSDTKPPSTFSENILRENNFVFRRSSNLYSHWFEVSPGQSAKLPSGETLSGQDLLNYYALNGKIEKTGTFGGLKNRRVPSNSLYVSQIQLTPGSGFIIDNLNGSLEYVFYAYTRNKFYSWLKTYDQSLDSSTTSYGNIFMQDWVSDYQLVSQAEKENRKYHTNRSYAGAGLFPW